MFQINLLNSAIDFPSFSSMKKMEANNALKWVGLQGTGKGPKVRSGVKDWEKYYSNGLRQSLLEKVALEFEYKDLLKLDFYS